MKKQLFKVFLLLGFGSVPWLCGAQGYRIEVSLVGSENKALYLGYYLHGRTYVKDTAQLVRESTYSFEGEESLDRGMYFLAKETTLLFDFVIGEDQFFTMETDEEDYVTTMKIVGDEDNELYFENLLFNLRRRKEAAPFLALLQDSVSNEEKENARLIMEGINRKVAAHQDSIVRERPKSVLSILLKSGKQVSIPDEIIKDTSESAQRRKLYYYRSHYWDYFDLGDPLLLRLPRPFYKEKVDDYLDNLTSQDPDSLKMAVDLLIALSESQEETYQTLVWHLTTKYQSSKVMGLDEVFVHLVDRYFLSGEMDFWANEQLVNNLKEKADQYRNSLIGMVAPNLILQNLEEQPSALHDLTNKYSVIYFYDPDCGHCKKETPVLKAFYDTTPYDVGVFTVSADSSMTKIKGYIDELGLRDWTNTNGTRTYGVNYQEVYDAYTTPTIYLLNEDKEIIAKKITAAQLNEVIANYEQVVR